MIGYVKCFDSNKAMSFKVSGKKLLKNGKDCQNMVKNCENTGKESAIY